MMNELARLRISFIENDRLRRRGRFTRRMTERLFLENTDAGAMHTYTTIPHVPVGYPG